MERHGCLDQNLTLLLASSEALLLAETAFMQLVYFFLLFRCCFFAGHISLLAKLCTSLPDTTPVSQDNCIVVN